MTISIRNARVLVGLAVALPVTLVSIGIGSVASADPAADCQRAWEQYWSQNFPGTRIPPVPQGWCKPPQTSTPTLPSLPTSPTGTVTVTPTTSPTETTSPTTTASRPTTSKPQGSALPDEPETEFQLPGNPDCKAQSRADGQEYYICFSTPPR